MAQSTAITEIGKIVDKYVFKYALPQDDYFLYLQHACDCYRDISLRHSNTVVTAKIAVSALGIIEMPVDMIGFSNLFIPINGEWWSFTKKPRKVTTTTTTNGVEGQNSGMGEGVDINDSRYLGLGAKGGVNQYYRNIDWTARRIFCDGFKSDTAVLQYTSSGLAVGAVTYIPQQCESVIDAYINWKREQISMRSMSLLQTLERYYTDELQKMRLFNWMISADELKDAWDAASTQSVQR
jgi:hypothetical protein